MRNQRGDGCDDVIENVGSSEAVSEPTLAESKRAATLNLSRPGLKAGLMRARP
jgi:hypothetical protein